jgi:hypothetical protein
MHTSLWIGLWVFASYVVFKIVASILEERQHRARAKELGCEDIVPKLSRDPLGIANTVRLWKAFTGQTMPYYLMESYHKVNRKYSRHVQTASYDILGIPLIHTSDPKNIQAVLATQFKDFELSDLRTDVFRGLLGKGIVSTL